MIEYFQKVQIYVHFCPLVGWLQDREEMEGVIVEKGCAPGTFRREML